MVQSPLEIFRLNAIGGQNPHWKLITNLLIGFIELISMHSMIQSY